MPRALYTAEAERDLREIAHYIAVDDPSASLAWLDEIAAVCLLVASQPELGEQLTTPKLGIVRRHTKGNYLVYYRPINVGAEIVRIVHGARENY